MVRILSLLTPELHVGVVCLLNSSALSEFWEVIKRFQTQRKKKKSKLLYSIYLSALDTFISGTLETSSLTKSLVGTPPLTLFYLNKSSQPFNHLDSKSTNRPFAPFMVKIVSLLTPELHRWCGLLVELQSSSRIVKAFELGERERNPNSYTLFLVLH